MTITGGSALPQGRHRPDDEGRRAVRRGGPQAPRGGRGPQPGRRPRLPDREVPGGERRQGRRPSVKSDVEEKLGALQGGRSAAATSPPSARAAEELGKAQLGHGLGDVRQRRPLPAAVRVRPAPAGGPAADDDVVDAEIVDEEQVTTDPVSPSGTQALGPATSAGAGGDPRQAAGRPDQSAEVRADVPPAPAGRRRARRSARSPDGAGGRSALQDQLAERTADLQRLKAEYDNYRRRVERDRQAVAEQATAKVLAGLLAVLDDIDRAREHGDLDRSVPGGRRGARTHPDQRSGWSVRRARRPVRPAACTRRCCTPYRDDLERPYLRGGLSGPATASPAACCVPRRSRWPSRSPLRTPPDLPGCRQTRMDRPVRVRRRPDHG